MDPPPSGCALYCTIDREELDALSIYALEAFRHDDIPGSVIDDSPLRYDVRRSPRKCGNLELRTSMGKTSIREPVLFGGKYL